MAKQSAEQLVTFSYHDPRNSRTHTYIVEVDEISLNNSYQDYSLAVSTQDAGLYRFLKYVGKNWVTVSFQTLERQRLSVVCKIWNDVSLFDSSVQQYTWNIQDSLLTLYPEGYAESLKVEVVQLMEEMRSGDS